MREASFLLLDQLQGLISNPKSLVCQDDDLVKLTFKKILEGGDTYTVAELENWFVNKASGVDQSIIDRVINMAHYQKLKFEANNKFRIVSDGNDCSCCCH